MTTVERPAAFSPFVTSKVTIPPTRPNLVARPRLFEQLNTGLQHPLTLIAAPAGSGKTTLLSEWIASNAERQTLNDKDLIQRSAFGVQGSDEASVQRSAFGVQGSDEASVQRSAFSVQRLNVAWVALDPGNTDP